MTKEEFDKQIGEPTMEDGRTNLEIWLQQRVDELEAKVRKLEIENNLMKELLSKPVTYTYGIR